MTALQQVSNGMTASTIGRNLILRAAVRLRRVIVAGSMARGMLPPLQPQLPDVCLWRWCREHGIELTTPKTELQGLAGQVQTQSVAREREIRR